MTLAHDHPNDTRPIVDDFDGYDDPADHHTLQRVRSIVTPIIGFVVLIGIWWAIAKLWFEDRPYLLPEPSAVARAIRDNIDLLRHALWQTFASASIGFLLSIVLALLLAMAMSTVRSIGDAFYPVAVVFQTVPIIAAAPVLVLWLKYGRQSLVAVVIMITFFPILSNTLAGLRQVHANHVEIFDLYHASPTRVLFKLRLPNALPSICAGLRISAGLAVTGANVGEFLIGTGGSKAGLGTLIISSAANLRTALLFGVAVFSVGLSVTFFLVVDTISKAIIRRWGTD
jgi:NitT/TauT family transport system permease protein